MCWSRTAGAPSPRTARRAALSGRGRAEEREEGGADHDGREDEGDGDRRADQGPAREVEPGEHPGARDADRQGQRRREERLPEREPGDPEDPGVRQDPAEDAEVEPAIRREPERDDRGDRVDEEDRQEGGRDRDREMAAGASHQRRTTCVHSSIQRSRFAAISAAGMERGAAGMMACSW